MAVYNSYKLYLAINGSKTSSTGKRDPRQHRKWIEDLVDLLFQVDNDDFGVDFISKSYLKYQYQQPPKGPKSVEKDAFLKAINRSLTNHLHSLNPSNKRGYCFFCPKKTISEPLKEQEMNNFQYQTTFQLNHNDLIDVVKLKELKEKRFRPKQTK
jgi:hypothetical protein